MNIIFDIGNVLLSFRPREYLQGLFNNTGSIELYENLIFKSDLWLDLDRGVIDEGRAIDILTRRHPQYAEGIRRVFAHWYSLFHPINETIHLLPRLKERGHKLYALSNFHREAFQHVRAEHGWFEYFDGMVISYEVNYLKPEPEIYQALMEKYRLLPTECIFLDDIEENLEAAREFGWEAIHFQSPRDSIAILLKTLDER